MLHPAQIGELLLREPGGATAGPEPGRESSAFLQRLRVLLNPGEESDGERGEADG